MFAAGCAPSLRRLYLESNQLATLPLLFTLTCERLVVLSLHSNALLTLPSLRNLTSLQDLRLDFNAQVIMPISVA
jgi:Leucine-rich repeat (LRR) protein